MALPVLIAKLGLPVLVSILGGALGKISAAPAQNAIKALENLQGALLGGLISPEQLAEANRHAEAIAAIKAREYETAFAEVNQSLRAEIVSDDPYVRRMRPTFGYLMAVTWAAQMMGLAYVVIFETEKAPAVLASMDALSTIWMVGLSVLGIYVYKRSEDKKLSSGLFEGLWSGGQTIGQQSTGTGTGSGAALSERNNAGYSAAQGGEGRDYAPPPLADTFPAPRPPAKPPVPRVND